MPDIVTTLRRKRSEAGFTLIEIVVGIAIMVIGLMGLAFAMVTSYRVERVAAEKKIALTWVSGQMERVRSLGFGAMRDPPAAILAGGGTTVPDGGYLVPLAWGSTPVGCRYKETPSGPVYFERWFHAPSTKPWPGVSPDIPLADPALAGLRPLPDMKGVLTDSNEEHITASFLSRASYMDSIMGRVTFRMPNSALNGVGEGTGYWVTVRLQWTGTSGPAEMKVSSFIGR